VSAVTLPTRAPLPAHTTIVAAILFVVVVVATPWQARAAFAGHAVLLVVITVVAQVRPGWLVPRFALVTPVLVFAAAMPFVAEGDRIAVGRLLLSGPGVAGAGLILVRAVLGLTTALLLIATTPADDLLAGLRRLRLPATLVNLVAFMLRFGEVIGGESVRLQWARRARGGGRSRWGEWAATTRGLGVLFVRSYARADRIDRALVARGWNGATPLVTAGPAAPVRAWAAALCLPGTAGLITAVVLLRVTG
jgi:cobalt/nickel transport system permease protein